AKIDIIMKKGIRQPASSDFHRYRGEQISISATAAKNEFGQVLEKAMQGMTVVITRHDAPKAVLLSMDEFNALSHATQNKLDALSGEFDALLARMQTPKFRRAMKSAFDASPAKDAMDAKE